MKFSASTCLSVTMLLIVAALTAHSAWAYSELINNYDTRYFLSTFSDFPQMQYLWRGADVCTFEGVLCDERTETFSILLPNAGLDGVIPGFGTDTTFNPANVRVTTINVGQNPKLTGNFPDHYGRLTWLRQIVLSNTGLRGSIPQAWNNLPNLVVVDLAGTGACMGLPSWDATALPELTYLNLDGDVMVRGSLSDSFGTFSSSSLKINFNGTYFCGCIPDSYNGSLRTQVLDSQPQTSSEKCATNKCGVNAMRCTTIDVALSTRSVLFPLVMALVVLYVTVVSNGF